MAVKSARRVSDTNTFEVSKRIRGVLPSNTVCSYWRAGKCNRNPCRFLHSDSGATKPNQKQFGAECAIRQPKQWQQFKAECPIQQPKQSPAPPGGAAGPRSKTWRRSPDNDTKKSSSISCNGTVPQSKSIQKALLSISPIKVDVSQCKRTTKSSLIGPSVPQNESVLRSLSSNPPSTAPEPEDKSAHKSESLVTESSVPGDVSQDNNLNSVPAQHSWFSGSGFSSLAKLEGHNKPVTGIALPSCSNKLFSGSKDKSLRIWDCNSGQCAHVVNLEEAVVSLTSDGPWVFVGLRNAIKALNINTLTEFTLSGPVGDVHAMAVDNGMLFARTEDGSILVYKFNSESNCPELVASMTGHSRGVVSLVIGRNRLYSGSLDKTIRVWDLDSLECIQTLDGHSDVVKSVLCWDRYLLSGSLDGTIKVWAATEEGNIEVIYTHDVEHGVVAFCGITDAEEKPILFCSCNDNSVRLYELPSFIERGRIFAKGEVGAIQIGPEGLFFTGDATGQISVWKLSGKPSPCSASSSVDS